MIQAEWAHFDLLVVNGYGWRFRGQNATVSVSGQLRTCVMIRWHGIRFRAPKYLQYDWSVPTTESNGSDVWDTVWRLNPEVREVMGIRIRDGISVVDTRYSECRVVRYYKGEACVVVIKANGRDDVGVYYHPNMNKCDMEHVRVSGQCVPLFDLPELLLDWLSDHPDASPLVEKAGLV